MPNVAGIVTMNTFANAYREIDGQQVLAMEYGGLSGAAVQAATIIMRDGHAALERLAL